MKVLETVLEKWIRCQVPIDDMQFGALSPTLFNIYTTDIPPPRAPVQFMACTDDITITSTHTSMSAAKKYIQPYIHKVFAGTKQNNLTLNTDKTTCTLFTPGPAEWKSNLDLKIQNTALPMAMHPTVLGLTLDPKLTYSTHIDNISIQAYNPLHMIKALTATGWGKQKETLMATYKAVMRPAREYASSIWCCCCCLHTPLTLVCGGVQHPAFGPPVSLSPHLAITPAGSVHKSRSDNVV